MKIFKLNICRSIYIFQKESIYISLTAEHSNHSHLTFRQARALLVHRTNRYTNVLLVHLTVHFAVTLSVQLLF
jgi:hypothetical protein